MTEAKHKKIHLELHKNLDELVSDFIMQTEKLPSETTILELIEWSSKQTENPTIKEK
jgi:hypothetical protein